MVLIETVCSMMLTVTIGRFIDSLTNQEIAMNQIYMYGIRLFVIAVILLAAGAFCGWTSMRAAAGLARELRNGMFDHIQEYAFSNIEHFSTESLVTRMTTDVMNVQNSALMVLRIVTMSPLTLICGLAMAFSINWRLGTVYAVAIPVLALGLYLIASRALPLFPKTFHLYDRLNSVVRENLLGIRVVKSFVREEYEGEKFLKVSDDLRRNFTKAECIFAMNGPLMQFAIYLCVTLITWLASRRIVFSQNGTLPGIEGMTTGQLQNLFTYGKGSNLCLKNINLHIRSGETVGIVGSTGSGKSSLVQLIPRLYDVTAGSVKVGGHDVREYDLEKLWNEVAVVLQKNLFFSGTIKENLRWGKEDATEEEMVRACQAAQAHEFVSRFRWIRYLCGTGRNQRIRGAAAASLHRQGAHEKSEDFNSGRFYQRGGYQNGCADLPVLKKSDAGYDQAYYCTANQLGSARGPDSCDRPGADRCCRHP